MFPSPTGFLWMCVSHTDLFSVDVFTTDLFSVDVFTTDVFSLDECVSH